MEKKNKKVLDWEDAPSGYVTLYNYKEPFTEFEGGYGYYGVLLFDGETDKVQCHLCGSWEKVLNVHLWREHNMKAQQYKEMVGLGPKTALISESVRAKMIEAKKNNPTKNLKHQKGRKRSAEEKEKIAKGLKRWRETDEFQNYTGTCPKQLIDRLKKDIKKNGGKVPSSRTIGYYETLVKRFGSWSEAVELATNSTYEAAKFGNRYSEEALIQELLDFEQREGRQPSYSDLTRGLLPSYDTYTHRFGSWSKALKKAFG